MAAHFYDDPRPWTVGSTPLGGAGVGVGGRQSWLSVQEFDEDYMSFLAAADMPRLFAIGDEPDRSRSPAMDSKVKATDASAIAIGFGMGRTTPTATGGGFGFEERAEDEEDRLQALYEAAGRLMRLRLQERARLHAAAAAGSVPAPVKPPPVTQPLNPAATLDYRSAVVATAAAQRRLQVAQMNLLTAQYHRRLQLEKQLAAQLWAARAGPAAGARTPAAAAWQLPPHAVAQPQSQTAGGARLHAVFLSGAKESAGTGVFLPRRPGAPAEQRHKPRAKPCSTALVPARVVQALNLDLDDLGARPRQHPVDAAAAAAGDCLVRRSNTVAAAPQSKPEPLCLPEEWTY